MVRLGHIYGHGFGERALARIQALGFRLRPREATYAGAQRLRFIDFHEGPSLELIEVTDDQAYREFVPDGMIPYCPGISLDVKRIEDIEHYEREFTGLHPYRLHVGYDGTTGRGAPGWHYLNFGVPVVPGTFIWLTAYDEPRPVRQAVSEHPNGVARVTGLVFDLEMEHLRSFRRLAGREHGEHTFRVGDLAVWSREALAGFPLVPAKQFPLAAVVLRAENLDDFQAGQPGVSEGRFMGERAVQISTGTRCWDLLVVAGEG